MNPEETKTIGIILHANRFDHWRLLLKEVAVVNVSQIIMFQTLKLCAKQNME